MSVVAVEGVARLLGEMEGLGLLEDVWVGVEAALALRVPLTVMSVVGETEGLALVLGETVGLVLRRPVIDAEAEVELVPEALGEARADDDTLRERLVDGVVVADRDGEALGEKAPEREASDEKEGGGVRVVLREAVGETVRLRVKEELPDAPGVTVTLAEAEVDKVLSALNEASSVAVAALLKDVLAVTLLTGLELALDCGEAVLKSDAVEKSDMVRVPVGLWELEDAPVALGRPLAL